ncbi:uncharacterized protein BX663DRAFT_530526 [Cokeromyces recurvatus]|uniref:uncharacterized protein n=1 Tax=Cokeromyces recurvatus TaxID=90255 RepID=UPI00222000A4|nr:uncharacterized protein BX663DRAFT_530526 [Cokeromyces recurvatus]KAI7903813.1 hypothetical protein BX663DRAFT_530526 [Cokeromyces recurvatus]
MTVDSKIVNFHILKNKKPAKDKIKTWAQVTDLKKKKAFKEQGLNKSLHFEGILETDGNGVSILKQNTATTRKKKLTEDSPGTSKKEGGTRSDNDAHANGRCVLIDPERRDILYCMKETSVVKHKEVLVFTKNDRSRRSRHFRTLQKSTKPSMVESAEALLSKTPSSTVDVFKFVDYIKTRSSVKKVLNQYYGNETKSSKDLYFPGSLFDFFLPFRKLKCSSKIFCDQNDQMLVKRLKKKFGHDAILVIGNWSASNSKYHEPTRNKDLIRMLKKNGFQVFNIDEYKTSSCCPTCESSLETFKTVANPRLHKRAAKMPTEIPRKLWNRDVAAVLNFRKVLMSLRETGKCPDVFSRKEASKPE